MGCNIDKLLIKGIRSFSPENTNVIEFYRPLTLIVGHNGAGKTTVIECLKMACTGELPPNTRSGQSFIHDPKVAGETEVKAQIKLRFFTQARQPVVIIRSFQLTQKKSTMQFKALDNVLQTVNRVTGQKEAISYRCADIDRQVPALMNVSKAILENVIFVHQEDSNWPLAEGQVLKKKFDDIFAATKYTKALEALRKLRTEKAQEVKVLKLKLDHLRTHMDNAKKLRGQVEEGTKKQQESERRIEQLEQQISEVSARLAELDGQLNRISRHQDELTRLQGQYEVLAKQNAELHARMLSVHGEEDLSMPLHELEKFAQELDPQLRDTKEMQGKLDREIKQLGRQETALREQHANDIKVQGRLLAEAEAHKRNQADLERYMRQVATELGLPVTDGVAAAFRAAFQARIQSAQEQLAAAKQEAARRDDEAARAIDRVNADLSAAACSVRLRAEQRAANERKAGSLQAQMGDAAVSEGMHAEALEREQQAQRKLEAREDQLRSSPLEGEVQRHQAKLAELAQRANVLRSERGRLASMSDSAARLKQKSQELEVMLRDKGMHFQARGEKLERVLGIQPGGTGDDGATLAQLFEGGQLKGRLEAAVRQRAEEAADRKAQLDQAQAKLSACEGKLAALRAQLQAAQKEGGQLRQKLDAGMAQAAAVQQPPPPPAMPMQQRLAAAEHETQTSRTQLAQLDAMANMHVWVCEKAEKDNVCWTCERSFATEAERAAFLAKQNAKKEAMPAGRNGFQAKLARAEQAVAILRQLEPASARHEALRATVVPELTRKVEATTRDCEAARDAVGDAQGLVAVAEHELKEAQALLSEVGWPLDKLAQNIRERQSEVVLLQRQVETTSGVRTVEDADRDLEDVEGERSLAEQARDEAARRLTRLRDDISFLRTEYHKRREETAHLAAAVQHRTALEAQVKELMALNEQLKAQVAEAERAGAPLEARKQELIREREAKREEARKRQAELEGMLQGLRAQEMQLGQRQRALDEYEQSGKAEALAASERSVREVLLKQQETEEQLKSRREELRLVEKAGAEAESTRRTVEDVLALAHARRQEEALARRLDEVQAQMGQVGDIAVLSAERQAAAAHLEALRSGRDEARGAARTEEAGVHRAQGELRAPEFEGIDEKFGQMLLKLKTTEMANDDLEKYHKALERALLSFHTSKMADINKVVKELWQKTYRNSDIDYIQIKADAEGAAGRSYNYRVVMYTGGAELDMRGRCSAGQKVLACLVIRLALAETFCINCGILALDEPTTNLDAENAASLAEALRSIMLSRKEQENFQLVIITHDEIFSRLVGTREHAEYMWRITKDDAGHSTILQEEIASD